MGQSYNNLILAFRELDIEDKKMEIIKKMHELLELMYVENKKIDGFNECLDVFSKYNDDNSYYDLLFTYVIALREESAKVIKKLE